MLDVGGDAERNNQTRYESRKNPYLNPLITYRYLIDPEETQSLLKPFLQQEIIGLDTETFFDFRTQQNRLSLLQLAAPTGEVLVVDALTPGIEAARALIENPNVMMAAHNARFDDSSLRSIGFEPNGFVDTLRLARRTLKLQSFGLASVSEHLLGVTLDKSYQRSDWRKRPLSRPQLDYAALDAQVALQVYQQITDKLRSQGRLEAELRRARLKATNAEEPERTTKPTSPTLRPLTGDERILLNRLQDWRKTQAATERLPLYMICPDKTLEHLVILRPRTPEQMNRVFGLGPARIAKYGAQMLGCLD